jgi:lipoprotein signal peptidase
MNSARLLVLLVVLDFASKMVALWFLPEGGTIEEGALFQLVLSRNESGIGTWGKAVLSYSSLPEALAGAFAYTGLSVALVTLQDWQRRKRRNVLVCVGAFVLSQTLGTFLISALGSPPAAVSVALIRGAGVLLVLTVWRLVPRGLWRHALTLLAAAALGNFLSLLYPPFRIIDFMYSHLTYLAFRYAVFNVADLYIPVGWACLAIAAARAVVRSFRRGRGDHLDAQETVV